MSKTATLTLTSNLEESDRLVDFVRHIATRIGCDSEKEHEILLVLTEAATNAICHGNQYNSNKIVEITATMETGYLKLTVRDQGMGFDPDTLPDPRRKENLLKSSGRGILLMQEFADRVTWSEKGTRVDILFVFNR